jgi:aryl-alcohol dehydrogenase-like predicted oxidoreductase
MKYRKLGKSGLEVSSLCLGGNVFGWTADEKTSFRILDAFVDAGGNFIDTADVYSRWASGVGGESETIIGKWFKQSGKRKQVVIATKVGMEMGPGLKGLSRKYILQEVEKSLERLQTDTIDLYQSHTDDAETPLDETLEAFESLIKAGKVRAMGASNYSAQRLREAIKVSEKRSFRRYESVQPLYNLYDREQYEKDLEPFCKEQNIGVITYFSLGAGFLTGKYRGAKDLGKSPRGVGMVKNYLNDRGLRILKALDQVAADLSTQPASVALAWLMARPSVTAPIASATSEEQLKSLIVSTRIELKPVHIRSLDQASAY